jgi:hypothetical protein
LLGRPIAIGLTLMALAAFVIEGASLPHSHAAGEPAFFNHDHDLTSCATFSGAPIPAASPHLSLAIVIAAAPPSAVRKPATAPRGHADSRAPPVA